MGHLNAHLSAPCVNLIFIARINPLDAYAYVDKSQHHHHMLLKMVKRRARFGAPFVFSRRLAA